MSKPLTLVILDGWGHTEEHASDAIYHANTPCWDQLWAERPHTLISASGSDVGLPEGQMGNSEVGHLSIGAGRVIYQDLLRIGHEVESGRFFHNVVLSSAVDHAIQAQGAIHVMGLVSPGGVHSHEDHLMAMLELALKHGAKQVYLHAILDGRDVAPQSARASLERFEQFFKTHRIGRIASVVGRYYAMDRDQRWERIEAAYQLVTEGEAEYQASSALDALDAAYARGESDEFVKATAIVPVHDRVVKMHAKDSVVFMNFRADRARQLTRAFVDPEFSGFIKPRALSLGAFVTLAEYDATLTAAEVAYPPEALPNVLGECLSQHGYQQLRAAETEKYAHVTFFMNGGVESPFRGEERVLIPSPKVATYDMQPEMSSSELTQVIEKAILNQSHDVIICNYANPDMVGHTGHYEAAVKAIEAVDSCLQRLVSATEQVGGQLLITADHGNAECMRNEQTQQPHTAHTSNLVPLVYVGGPAKLKEEGGTLVDLAPTVLALLDLPQPEEMTGRNLAEKIE